MRPRAIESKIASPVARSPQSPHAISSPRFACGWRRRASSSSSLPVIPESHCPGKDQGDLVTGSRQILETGARLVRRSHAHDAVMPRVAVAQLPLDVPECARILVNGDKRGTSHSPHFSAHEPGLQTYAKAR